MAFESFRQAFRSSERKIAIFCQDRVPQTDEQFLAEACLPTDPEAARIAVAVRRAVASVGKVDPLFIRADDVYPDTLGVLPLWDSMDWLVYVMELEKELNTRIAEEEMVQVIDPRPEPTFAPFRVSVREMAAAAHRFMTGRRAGA